MTIKLTTLPGAIVTIPEVQKPGLITIGNWPQTPSRWQERLQTLSHIHQQELFMLFRRPALYIGLSLALLATGLMLQTHLNFVQGQGLHVTSGPLNGLLHGLIILASLGVGRSVISGPGREQVVGTPDQLRAANAAVFPNVLGKFLAQLTTVLVLGLTYGGCLVLMVGPANFSLSPDLIGIGLVSLLIMAQVVALALFVASLCSQDRAARNLFLGIVLTLIVIQSGPEALTHLTSQDVYTPLILAVQHALAWLRETVAWLSPYAQLSRGIEAVMIGQQVDYLTALSSAALQTVLFLSLSIIRLQRREALK